ncbi:putative inorganic phosphate cotransporter isoform X3 [Lucilia sericata]|uniref:putative inorganic phosphate cotransporter isoform X3 n=1 Tax=Lucilia sericata TaxID=13632 RepID=UPI0018A7F504|nr:putative inorganic phosphate cotransporter isoform X3 [Lucilia sericata]
MADSSVYIEKPQPEWGVKLSKFIFIPQRVILALMGFFAVVNAYTMRICLSMVIPALVLPRNYSDEKVSEAHCPVSEDLFEDDENPLSGTYDWSQPMQGFILSSFYIGYLITHVPGAIEYTGHVGLIVMRILMGLGEGTTFPTLSALIAHWVPKNERGAIGSLILGAGPMGTIIGNLLPGFLLARSGWPVVFYIFGILAVLWFIFFTLFCFSDPASHPFIKPSEKEYLIQELGSITRRRDLGATPWKEIFLSMPMYALLVAQVGHDWAFYILVTDLPKYLNDVMQIPIKKNAIYSSLPFAIMWIVSIIAGILADFLIKYEVLSLTAVRKLMTLIAAFGPTLFAILASYAGCNEMEVITYFCLCLGIMGFYFGGGRLTPNDLSPNYAGTLMAITNGFGSFAGILAPYSVGLMTPNTTIQEWRLVFWVAGFILSASAVFYCVWVTGDTQSWNEPSPKKDVEKE